MKYIVETQLPDYEDTWHPVIDLDNSKIYPIIRKFNTKEEAETWAEKHSVSNHKWRIVEDDAEE